MQELDDAALLREYVERDSEEAFAALVTRHVNKVYSVALRHTGNPDSAEEITQAVFVILAKKSRQLGQRVILSGWLYQAARLTAVTFIRGGIRRARREQEAYMQTVLNENESEAWRQIAPLLDVAMAGLNEADRHAVVLRFFDGKSLREVGAGLGTNEDAARKRVSRALEKMRTFFARRGVSSTTAIIAGAISTHSVQAAPVALARTVTTITVAKGAAASGSTLTLVKEAMKAMTRSKLNFVIGAGVAIILAAGTATTLLAQHQHGSNPGLSYKLMDDAWQFTQGVDQTKFAFRVVVSSWDKTVRPKDITLSIQSATKGQIPVPLDISGQFLNFPHDEALRRENPPIIANQPKDTLFLEPVYWMPKPENLTFRYRRLGDAVAEANKAITNANRIIKADYAGELSPFKGRVQGMRFWFPIPSAGKAKIKIESAAGTREYTADIHGNVRLKLDQALLAENPEVILSEKPFIIRPMF